MVISRADEREIKRIDWEVNGILTADRADDILNSQLRAGPLNVVDEPFLDVDSIDMTLRAP